MLICERRLTNSAGPDSRDQQRRLGVRRPGDVDEPAGSCRTPAWSFSRGLVPAPLRPGASRDTP